MSPTPLFPLLLLAGCFVIGEDEHRARLAAACPDTGDADTDADTDTDTDTDTDADTDTDTDTDGPIGRLTGRFTMTVDGASTDSCEGAVDLDVDEDSLYGTFDCRFDGVSLYDDQIGTVDGTTGGGTLEFQTDFDTTVIWTGSLGDAGSLTGVFSASDVPWNVDRLDLDGSFVAAPAAE